MKWLLMSLILDAVTGEEISRKVEGVYEDPIACVQAAIDKGPQEAKAGQVPVYRCQQNGNAKSSDTTVL